jgi:hypothetical protein
MILTESRGRIATIAGDLLDRIIQDQLVDEPFDFIEYGLRRPFQHALVPIEQIWKGARFERSFVTSLGQNVFQEIAVEVAQATAKIAAKEHKTDGEVWTGQLETIDAILRELRSPKSRRRPNWAAESDFVIRARGTGYRTQHSVHSDIYIRRASGRDDFYSLKTSKPNLDQTELAKRMMLELVAMNPQYRAWFALPDNPYRTRDDYGHAPPSRIFNMRSDACVLIGKEFWDHVGGVGAYEELLEILRDVGESRRDLLEKRYLGI